MKMKRLISIFLVFALTAAQEDDPCLSEHHLTLDQDFRSTAVRPTPGDLKCDIGLPSPKRWYRFTSPAGGKMPRTCIRPYYCSTVSPIWLEIEREPLVGETLTGRGCIVDGPLIEDCCSNRYPPIPIQVKHCPGDFFVYELAPTPGCSMLYCAGNRKKCPDGEVSEDGYDPCADASMVPNVTAINDIRWEYVEPYDEQDDKFNLRCEWEVSAPLPHPVHTEVQWVAHRDIGDRDIQIDEVVDKKIYLLHEDLLDCPTLGTNPNLCKWRMGETISCRVRARYNINGELTLPSAWRQSNEFLTGIEVTPTYKEITLAPEDTDITATITLHFRLPMLGVCFVPPGWPCDDRTSDIHFVNNVVNGGSYQDMCANDRNTAPGLQTNGDCRIQVTHGRTGDWQNDLKKRYYAEAPTQAGTTFSRFLISIYTTTSSFHKIWEHYTLPSYTVRILQQTKDVINGFQDCHANNDPHMKTFTGSRYEFHPVTSGEYVMYKYTPQEEIPDSPPIIVTAYFTHCGNPGSHVRCSCGMGVRVFNEIIVINQCESQKVKWGQTVQEYPRFYVSCLKGDENEFPGLRILNRDDGKTFEITLPNGAVATYSSRGGALGNVNIKPNIMDEGKTTGLCGGFNMQSGTECMNREGETIPCTQAQLEVWKAAGKERIITMDAFERYPDEDDPLWTHCECTGDGDLEIECKAENNNLKPRADSCVLEGNCQGGSCDIASSVCNIENQQRRTRGATFQRTVHNILQENNEQHSWTETTARDHCTNYLLSQKATSTFLSIEGFENRMSSAIDECVLDILATNSTIWATQTYESLKSSATGVMISNISMMVSPDGPNGSVSLPPDLTDNLCPNDCSNHGNCNNSICICEDDFTGTDCSKMKNTPPILYFLPGNGTCDMEEFSCHSTNVVGSGFLSSENLTCHIQPVEIVISGKTKNMGEEIETQGKLWSVDELECPIPFPRLNSTVPATGYNISVSNDGFTKSTEKMLFVIYKSSCVECEGAGSDVCDENSDMCKINGQCIPADGMHPEGQCQKCVPGSGFEDTPGCRVPNQCVLPGGPHPDDPCRLCDPLVGWVRNPDCQKKQRRANGSSLKKEKGGAGAE